MENFSSTRKGSNWCQAWLGTSTGLPHGPCLSRKFFSIFYLFGNALIFCGNVCSNIRVISEDSSSFSLLTRLVSVAALLKCYSPSSRPLCRLLSHVPSLSSITKHHYPRRSVANYRVSHTSLTYKARWIKCDEQRPTCQRCTKPKELVFATRSMQISYSETIYLVL